MAYHAYSLNLEGPPLRAQREFLLRLVPAVTLAAPYLPGPADRAALDGLIALTDALADQAHDHYGLDCLLEDPEACDCQQPGHFHSGVPGILAHVESGRLVEGGTVERCDLCERFPSDQAALERLQALGIAPRSAP